MSKFVTVLFLIFTLPPMVLGPFGYLGVSWSNLRNFHLVFLACLLFCSLLKRFRKSFFQNIIQQEPYRDSSHISFKFISWLYLAIFLEVSLLEFFSFNISASDFSIFDWMIPMTDRGAFMSSPVLGGKNHFSIHFTPIIFLAYIPHRIFDSPLFFVCLHAFLLWLPVIPIEKILNELRINKVSSIMILLAYLNFNALHGILMYDFHIESFYLPILMFLLLAFLKGNRFTILIFCVLTCFVKEDGPLIIFSASFAAFLHRWIRCREALVLSTVSIIYFLIVTIWIMPSYGDGTGLKLAGSLKYGTSLSSLTVGILSHPFSVIEDLMSGGWIKHASKFFFTPLLFPITSISIFPNVLMHSISTRKLIREMSLYYPAIIIPFLIFGWILFIAKLQKLKRGPLRSIGYGVFVISFLIVTFSGGGYLTFGRIGSRYLDFKKLFARIEIEQPICAQGYIIPQLGYPNSLERLSKSCIDKGVAQIILNPTLNTYPHSSQQFNQLLNDLRADKRYHLYKTGNFYLFRPRLNGSN